MSLQTPHILGLVGTFEPDANFFGFLYTVATHYHDNGKGLCILTTLQTKDHLEVASRLLEIKRHYNELRLEVAINMKHKALSEMSTRTISGQKRNRIIAAADEVHVIEEQNLLQLESFVLSHADTILFSSHEEMDYICFKLNTYGSNNLIWEPRHSNRLHKKRYDRLFYKTFNFIRGRYFKVKTGDLPRELLSAWIAPSNGKYSRYLGCFDQTDILLRLLTPKCPHLPLTVFIYAFTFYDQIWTLETSPKDVKVLFEQFQTLLRRTAAARANNYKLDFIDIFDFGSYATSLETTAWIDVSN